MEMKAWAVNKRDEWAPFDGRIEPSLAPGLYRIQAFRMPFMPTNVSLKSFSPLTDTLLPMEGSLAEYVIKGIQHFWDSKSIYKEMGLIHKRGIMLEGTPGSGKTSICMLVAQEVAKMGGVGIYVTPTDDVDDLVPLLKDVRDWSPNIPLVIVLEDIDQHNAETGEIHALLRLLDGDVQIDNVVYIATTNYVEKLDARLTNRPSRFDEIIKSGPPSKKARATYLKKLLPENQHKHIPALVANSQNLNLSHLKELAICTVVYGRDISETTKRLKKIAGTSAGFQGEEAD